MIILDTSVLVDALCGAKQSGAALRHAIECGERVRIPALVLYEGLRGPRLAEELMVQEMLFPAEAAIPFGPREAVISAVLYRRVRRPRARSTDLAIAACALERQAGLWKLNPRDFEDIPGLLLHEPSSRLTESS